MYIIMFLLCIHCIADCDCVSIYPFEWRESCPYYKPPGASLEEQRDICENKGCCWDETKRGFNFCFYRNSTGTIRQSIIYVDEVY